MERATLPLDERFRAGESEALELIYEQLIGHLKARAISVGCDRHGAEDVAHDVIEHALKTHSRFDPERGSIKTWLLGIARYEALDSLAARAIDRSQPLNLHDEELLALAGTYEIEDPNWTDRRLLRIARSLGVEQRQILALRNVLDLSFAEIADRLGKSTGAVKASDFAARRAMRTRYDAAIGAADAEARRHAAVRRSRLSPVLSARRALAYC